MDSSSSPLLSLAPELRNEIYKYTFYKKGMYHLIISITGNEPQPPLMRTCRQLRNEALPLWYTNKDFRVTVDSTNAGGPLTWFSRIHPDDQKLISSVCVEWNVSPSEERIFKAVGPRSSPEQLTSYRQKMFTRGRVAVKALAPFLSAMRDAGIKQEAVTCDHSGILANDRCRGTRYELLDRYLAELATLLTKTWTA